MNFLITCIKIKFDMQVSSDIFNIRAAQDMRSVKVDQESYSTKERKPFDKKIEMAPP